MADDSRSSRTLVAPQKTPSVDEPSSKTSVSAPQRQRLPDERRAITHHFSVGGQEGYVTVGLYEDGQPGKLFIKMAKEGSTVSGLTDAFATRASLALQYGVPLYRELTIKAVIVRI